MGPGGPPMSASGGPMGPGGPGGMGPMGPGGPIGPQRMMGPGKFYVNYEQCNTFLYIHYYKLLVIPNFYRITI